MTGFRILTTNDLLIKLQNEEEVTASKILSSSSTTTNGVVRSATRYCQLIREANKTKRVDFCQTLLRTHESFGDVIFTDESMIQLKPAHRKV